MVNGPLNRNALLNSAPPSSSTNLPGAQDASDVLRAFVRLNSFLRGFEEPDKKFVAVRPLVVGKREQRKAQDFLQASSMLPFLERRREPFIWLLNAEVILKMRLLDGLVLFLECIC